MNLAKANEMRNLYCFLKKMQGNFGRKFTVRYVYSIYLGMLLWKITMKLIIGF